MAVSHGPESVLEAVANLDGEGRWVKSIPKFPMQQHMALMKHPGFHAVLVIGVQP